MTTVETRRTPPRLSIIVPVYNEAAILADSLQALAPFREQGAEVIVVDGQSRDASFAVASAAPVDRVLPAVRGRALQMNLGAAKASGDHLLFLHADTRLPADAPAQIAAALDGQGHVWGRFDVRIEGQSRSLRMVAGLMNRRSRLTGIATGDQAIFVTRAAFESVGGYPKQPLMEDLELSRSLRRIGPPACLRSTVLTSGRRWERDGVLRTILLMWRLRTLYWLGVSPQRLARQWRS